MSKTNRRKFLGCGTAVAAAAAVAAVPAAAQDTREKAAKKVIYRNGKSAKTPLFNGVVTYGNLVFIAGIGYHSEGDIKVHTKNVLDQVQKALESAGSSMDKVLKCNVYLNDLKDY